MDNDDNYEEDIDDYVEDNDDINKNYFNVQ
jgi:hypothetical protein